MAGTINTSVQTSAASGAPAPAAEVNNNPLFGFKAAPAAAPAPVAVSTAPHPSAPTPAATPVAAPVANKSVTLPNGAVVSVDSKGNIVSGDPTNGGKGVAGTDASHSQAAYEATQKSAADKAAADALAQKTGSGGNDATKPYVSSSDSVEAKEQNITSTLQGLQADNPAAVQAHNDHIAEVTKQADALEKRRQQEIDQINKDFEAQKANTEKRQANDTGVEGIMLQRAGGYLGSGASQTGALLSLSRDHALEMQSLEAKRQDAINTANTAIEDKQFALAQAKVQEAKDYATAQQTAKQKYFEDQIQVNKDQRDKVTFDQDQADKSLKAMANLTPDQVSKMDPATLKKIDDAYGVPGFAKNYVATQHAINTAKSQDDALVAQQKMLTLLEDIPKGQKVTFPNPADPSGPGITFTGLGKAGDISSSIETNDAGGMTLISYDKGANTVTRQFIGYGGKTKTKGEGDVKQVAANRLAPATAALTKLAVPVDPSNPTSPSYITASQYVNAYQQYVRINPGHGDEFKTQHPMNMWVMPSQLKVADRAFLDTGGAK